MTYENIKEVWFMYDGPQVGVLVKDNVEYCFNSYADNSKGGPLYLVSKIPENAIQDIRENKLDIRTTFSHPEAIIYKEVEGENEDISFKEVLYTDLTEDELPYPGIFLQ